MKLLYADTHLHDGGLDETVIGRHLHDGGLVEVIIDRHTFT